jgi:hypothetical protein
LLTLKE